MAIILSKQERVVMAAVYEICKEKRSALIGLEDVMARIKTTGRFCFKRPKALEAADILTDTQPEEADAPAEAETEAVAAEEAAEEKKRRRIFFRRHITESETVAAAEPKVFTDDPPVYKGLRVYEKPVKYADIPHILEILYMEEYFEVTPAADGSETKYIVELLNRGLRWERDERDRKRNSAIRVLTIVATPILSFLLGIVLRTCFH